MEPKGSKKHDAFFLQHHYKTCLCVILQKKKKKTCLCLSKKIFFILFIFSFSLYKKKEPSVAILECPEFTTP
jgi:hypothetical protein